MNLPAFEPWHFRRGGGLVCDATGEEIDTDGIFVRDLFEASDLPLLIMHPVMDQKFLKKLRKAARSDKQLLKYLDKIDPVF